MNGIAELQGSTSRQTSPGDQVEQGGFSTAVGPDDPDAVFGTEAVGEVIQQQRTGGTAVTGDLQVFRFDRHFPDPATDAGHFQLRFCFPGRGRTHRLNPLEPRLLLRAAGFRSLPQPCQFAAQHALELGRGGQIGGILLGLALQVGAVVAVVAAGLTLRHLNNATGDAVQHIPVMGHQHHGTGVAIQPALQPLDCRRIQVVRRLVEQQNVGAGHKGRCQSHPFAVSARQGLNRFVQVTDAEALKHFLALLFQAPGLRFVHALAEVPEFPQQGGVVRL